MSSSGANREAPARSGGKRQIQVSQPIVIKDYNQEMGGVDLMDRLPETYRLGTTVKKMFIFVNIINVNVGATWRLFERANPNSKMMHLQMRTYITLVLIKSEDETRINQEKFMARESSVVTGQTNLITNYVKGIISRNRTDKSDNELAPACQGRCFVWKRNTRLKRKNAV